MGRKEESERKSRFKGKVEDRRRRKKRTWRRKERDRKKEV